VAEGDQEGAGQGVVDEAEVGGGVASLAGGLEVEGPELMTDADGGGGAVDRGPDRCGAVAAQMLLERLDAGRDAAVPIEPRVLAPSPLIARDSS